MLSATSARRVLSSEEWSRPSTTPCWTFPPATHASSRRTVPYDASDKHVSRVSSLSLVRYRTNDYSVPVAYGHREVVVRGYVGEVVISCGAEVIARHRRSYERDDFVFDPIHYLPLLEYKTGALD